MNTPALLRITADKTGFTLVSITDETEPLRSYEAFNPYILKCKDEAERKAYLNDPNRIPHGNILTAAPLAYSQAPLAARIKNVIIGNESYFANEEITPEVLETIKALTPRNIIILKMDSNYSRIATTNLEHNNTSRLTYIENKRG